MLYNIFPIIAVFNSAGRSTKNRAQFFVYLLVVLGLGTPDGVRYWSQIPCA